MALDVDGDHLAGSEAAGFDDRGGVEVDQAHLGAHHDESVAGDLIAGRAEAVAVHRRADEAAVGEGDGGGAVPGFGEAGVVLVEAAQARLDVLHLLPGFGDEHHHRVEHAAPGGDQEVERFIEGEGVGAALADHGVELGDGFAPDVGLERGAAGEHPVAVAQQGVDLTVVSDAAEGLGDAPVGQGVGGVALVKECERRGGAGVGEVGVEAAQLRGDHQPLVDDGAGGEGDDVGLGDGVCGVALGEGADFGLGAAASEVEQALEVDLVELAGAADDDLLDPGQAAQSGFAEHVGVGVDLAPAGDGEVGALHSGVDDRAGAGGVLGGQEDHAEREAAGFGVGEGAAEPLKVVAVGVPGDFDGDACAVAGVGVGVDGAAVGEADDAHDGLLDELVGADAVDSGDETRAAGVAEALRVIEAGRGSFGGSRHALSVVVLVIRWGSGGAVGRPPSRPAGIEVSVGAADRECGRYAMRRHFVKVGTRRRDRVAPAGWARSVGGLTRELEELFAAEVAEGGGEGV